MIDTLTLELRAEQAPDIDFLGQKYPSVEYAGSSTTRHGQTYINGHLGNLRISISSQRVKITGSLCKWYLGDNFQTLTRSDIIKAFNKLKQTLCLPLWDADITRLDIGTNFVLTRSPELYFECLGELTRYKRLPVVDNGIKGVNYQNGQREFKFYDKIREQKHRHKPIPEIYIGKNVLRIELSISNRLREQFKKSRVTPRDLIDNEFYISLIKQWQTLYHNITKKKTMGKIDLATLPTTKEMTQAALKIAIDQQGGEALFCEKIKEARKQGLITVKQQEHKIKMVRDVAKAKFSASPTEEITDELGKKVDEVAHLCR